VYHRGEASGPSSGGGLVARKPNRGYRTRIAASDCTQGTDSYGPSSADRVAAPWLSGRFYTSPAGPATRPAAACRLLIGDNRENLV